jgi:LPS O-antigen subunit length determinant protein (WzzB/FepE family)
MEQQDQEISLQDIFKVFRKRWKIIVLPALATAVLAAGISWLMPRQYESYAFLRLGCNGTKALEDAGATNEIMKSLPNLMKIAEKVKIQGRERISEDIVKYESKGDLLKISARAKTPEKAQELVATSMDLVMERHRLLYEDAEKQLATMVKYVRETLHPVPLSSGINELIIRPSSIEVGPVLDNEPVRTKTKVILVLVFVAVLFMDTLVAFYFEGTEK